MGFPALPLFSPLCIHYSIVFFLSSILLAVAIIFHAAPNLKDLTDDDVLDTRFLYVLLAVTAALLVILLFSYATLIIFSRTCTKKSGCIKMLGLACLVILLITVGLEATATALLWLIAERIDAEFVVMEECFCFYGQ